MYASFPPEPLLALPTCPAGAVCYLAIILTFVFRRENVRHLFIFVAE